VTRRRTLAAGLLSILGVASGCATRPEPSPELIRLFQEGWTVHEEGHGVMRFVSPWGSSYVVGEPRPCPPAGRSRSGYTRTNLERKGRGSTDVQYRAN
jgi:hypothetical protein